MSEVMNEELVNEDFVEDEDVCEFSEDELVEMIRAESDERLRFLMSLGHPNSHGEPYSRFVTMDECKRRGVNFLVGLGWPISADSVYKNKYTGCERLLSDEVCPKSGESFEDALSCCVWSVVEHWWPKDSWVSDELFDKYKSTLSFFARNEAEAEADDDGDGDGDGGDVFDAVEGDEWDEDDWENDDALVESEKQLSLSDWN